MQSSTKGAAAHTAADLDAMDDKLRRLGLDVGHVGGAAESAKVQGSEDYLRRIRTVKAEKQQAQRDRVARQAVTAEKHLTVHSSVASSRKAPGTPPTEETLAADKALLANDTAEAAVRVQQDYLKNTTQQIRAERLLQASHKAHTQPAWHASTLGSSPAGHGVRSTTAAREATPWSATAMARAEAKRRAIAPWCAGVALGVVELAMEMSDHRHLPATGLAGRPVYRLRQDLGVSQWRERVDEVVFGTAAEADAAAEQQAKAAEGAREGKHTQGNDSAELAADAISASALAELEEQALGQEAARCIEVAARAEAEEGAQAQQKAVAAVLSKLQGEVVRLRKAAEEAVRREADEPHPSDAPTSEAGGVAVDGTQREEVLPGWAQRMPPAGCFVYGDDLSGARLLSDTIELCMQRSLYAAHQSAPTAGKQGHHTTHAASVPVVSALASAASDFVEDSHRGLEATLSNISFGKSSAPRDPFANFTAGEIGVESGEGVEGGVTVTYVTPKTLLSGANFTSMTGDTRRAGSANRGGKAQAHGLPSSGATAGPQGGAPNASGTGAGSGAAGGGGGSAVRGARRASTVAGDGRRGIEQQLVEAAVREIVRVHRHNLGVLVSDKIPSWSPSTTAMPSPPQAAGTPAAPAAAEVGEAAQDAVRPPLHALFLVGFPDTSSFAEMLADRLRTATAAAETELMEVEARRRASEQHAVATAAAEASKPRSPSTKSAKGSAAPPRQKPTRSPKTAVEAEEGAVSAIVDRLRLLFALPPLSVLSVFLTYDVPTRERRLEDAACSVESPQSLPRGMCESNEDDTAATMSAGSPCGELFHTIFHPWRVEEKEVEPSRGASFRRPVGGSTAACSAASLTFAPTAAPPPGFARSLDAWSVPCLRMELEQQDARQHLQRQAWATAVAPAFARRARDAVSAGGDLRRVPASFYGAGKRRDKLSPGSTAQDSERSATASRQASLTLTPAKASAETATDPASPPGMPGPAEGAYKPSAAPQLPRAIFFTRVLDVSDVAAPTAMAVDAAADGNALGRAVWRASITSGSAGATLSNDGLPDLLHLTARAATVDHVLTQLHLLCRPAGGRALSGDLLVPYQIPEPFRLGDYRLSDTMCARLRQVHEVYSSVLPEPSSAFRTDRPGPKPVPDAALMATAAALQAETEAWGAVLQYAEGLYSLVAYDVFHSSDEKAGADSGATGDGAYASVAAGTMNSTARFTGIDRSYARAKDALAQHTDRAVVHIQDCLALLLRLSVDVCVAQLAATMRLLCTLLDRSSQHKFNSLGWQALPPALAEGGIENAFLSSVPRLSEDTARSLVALLVLPLEVDANAREGARQKFSAALSQVYWAKVKAAAVDIVAQHFDCGVKDDPLAEKSSLPDALSWDDALDHFQPAVKPLVPTLLAQNLSLVMEVLLEHATAALPCPLTRLSLLLQEFQYKAQSLHEGADAWVELLYHDVLAAAQPGKPTEQQHPQRRPQSIDQLADGPQAVLQLGASSAAVGMEGAADGALSPSQPPPSRWRCCELDLFLTCMPQQDASGLVTTTSFQLGLLLNQLPRIWRFLPDYTAELAARVDYALSRATVEEKRSPRRALRSATAGLAVSPDTALDAYLVYDCPCKPSSFATPSVPFLTVDDVVRLSTLASGESTNASSAAAAAASATLVSASMQPTKASFLHLQQWLVSVALGRSCYCDSDVLGTAHAARSPRSTTAFGSFARCATRHLIRQPSTRALRHTLLSLPVAVLEQESALTASCAASSPTFLANAISAAPLMAPGWVQVQWWWMDVDGDRGDDTVSRHDVALCWTLWRIFLHPLPSTEGVGDLLSTRTATPPAFVPSLLSVLRLLLIGAAGELNPREERVRRAFHCVAALRCVHGGLRDVSMSAEDSDSTGAMTIEDEMALTREEYTLFGELLASPVSPAVSEAASYGAASTKGMADLVTDMQLLLQVENTDRVTLPLLLSSRWAQLMLNAHF